jgi:alpha-glucosidase
MICAVNCGDEPVRLPPHDDLVIASGPVQERDLPPDTAAWLLTA